MSDNFDNNNNVFGGDMPQPENNNEFSSFPTGGDTEPENGTENTSGDFSSGEYHFAYPKYANESDDSPSASTEPTAQTDDASSSAQPEQSAPDNQAVNDPGASNPY